MTRQGIFYFICICLHYYLYLIYKLYVFRGVETSEDEKTAGMRSKLQEEIQTLKWQEDILDKQLEVTP